MTVLPLVLLVVHFILFFFLKKSEKLYALITPRNVIIFFIFTVALNIIPSFLITNLVPMYGALIGLVFWVLVIGLLVGIIYKIFKKSFKINFIEGFFTGTLAMFILLVIRLINYSQGIVS